MSDCTGDTNCDGIVNSADFSQVINDWGPCGDGELCRGDTNGDCVVNNTDLDNVRYNWGPCLSAGAAPPPVQTVANLFLANPTPSMAAFAISILEQLGQP
jgi:hypothetical protein